MQSTGNEPQARRAIDDRILLHYSPLSSSRACNVFWEAMETMDAKAAKSQTPPTVPPTKARSPRPSPWWLRFPVGLLFTIILFAPLGWAYYQIELNEAAKVRLVARGLLEALQTNSKVDGFLAPEVRLRDNLPNPFRLGPAAQYSGFPNVLHPWIADPAVVGDQATVQFGVAYKEDPKNFSGPIWEMRSSNQQKPKTLREWGEHFAGITGTIQLVKENGRWWVVEFEFSHPTDESLASKRVFLKREDEEQRAKRIQNSVNNDLFKAIAPKSAQELEALWTIDVDYREKPLQEALEELLRDIGVTLTVSPLRQGNALDRDWAKRRKVTLQKRRASRLEVADEISRQARSWVQMSPLSRPGSSSWMLMGLPEPGRAGLAGLLPPKGSVREHVAFAGPLQLTPALRLSSNYATGVLELTATPTFLSPPLMPLFEKLQLRLSVDQVVAPDQSDLLNRNILPYWFPYWRPSKAEVAGNSEPSFARGAIKTHIPLRNLFLHVDRIEKVRGKISLPVPNRVLHFVFPTSDSPQTIRRDGVNAKIQIVRPKKDTGAYDALIELEAMKQAAVLWQSYTETNLPMEHGSLWLPKEGRFSAKVSSEVCRIEVKAIQSDESAQFPFEIASIAIPGRPPKGPMANLKPGQKSPVRVGKVLLGTGEELPPNLAQAFVAQLAGRVPQVALANVALLPMDIITLRIVFQDAEGKRMGELVHTQAGGTDEFAASMTPILQPSPDGNLTWIPLKDLPIPPNAVAAEASVISVVFSDGSMWKAPSP